MKFAKIFVIVALFSASVTQRVSAQTAPTADEMSTDKMSTNKMSHDKMGKMGTDKMGTDKMSAKKAHKTKKTGDKMKVDDKM